MSAPSSDGMAVGPNGFAAVMFLVSGSHSAARRPAVIPFLPRTLGGLTITAAGMLLVMALAVAMSAAEAITGRAALPTAGRFSLTLAAARAALDLRLPSAAALWLGTAMVLMTAFAAAGIRLIQRQHDRPQAGRAWGWLAAVMAGAACAAEVPLGRLAGGLLADATGITLGPAGIGWWFLIAASIVGGVGAWAVVSLSRRLGTAAWMGLGGAAWLAAAAWVWFGSGDTGIIWSNVAWSMGAAFLCIATMVAARSAASASIPARSAAPRRIDAPPLSSAPPREPSIRFDADDSTRQDETDFVDGSKDHGSFRHLSKAERKRLKKMARLQQAG